MQRAKPKQHKLGNYPVLGCGVGLRPQHYQYILDHKPQSIDWFEAVSENYLNTQGRPLWVLEQVRNSYPIGLHGVSLSVGSADPLNQTYLSNLKELVDRIEPEIVSDHLCWASVDQEELHDLLPLPYTEEALSYLIYRVEEVQSFLGRQILIENISSYLTYSHSTIPEYEFLRELAKRSGCGILLDVNNIYVNSTNHGFKPQEFLDAIPSKYVGQFHVAGHMNRGKFLFDTHEGPILPEVWKIYEDAMKRYGQVSTLIEWDSKIPEFDVLEDENDRARKIYDHFQIQPRNSKEDHDFEVSQMSSESINDYQQRLKGLQKEFKEEIYQVEDHNVENKIKERFNLQAGDPGHERLKVYAEGHHSVINEALGEVFEATKHLTGENAFNALIYDYIKAHPSEHYNLNFRGKMFPHFLETHKVIDDLPFLPDLAKLEWFKSVAYHEQFKAPFDIQKLAKVPTDKWDHAVITFQKFLFVINSQWPLFDLWNTRNMDTKSIDIQVEGRPQSIIIAREGLDVTVDQLTQDQAMFLQSLLNKMTLGSACAALNTTTEELPPVMEWFADWAKRGLITDISLEQRVVG